MRPRGTRCGSPGGSWDAAAVTESGERAGRRQVPQRPAEGMSKPAAVHSSKSEQPTQESPLRPVLHAVRTT